MPFLTKQDSEPIIARLQFPRQFKITSSEEGFKDIFWQVVEKKIVVNVVNKPNKKYL